MYLMLVAVVMLEDFDVALTKRENFIVTMERRCGNKCKILLYTVIHYVWNPLEDLLKLEQIQYELHLLHTLDEILLHTVVFCCEILPYISTSYRIIKMEQMEWSHYQN